MNASQLAKLEREHKAIAAKIEKARKAMQDEFATHNGEYFQAQYRRDRKDWTVRRKGNGSAHVVYIASQKEAVKVVDRLDAITNSILANASK